MTFKIVLYVTNGARHVTTFPQACHSLIAITVGMYTNGLLWSCPQWDFAFVNEDNEEVSTGYILNVC